MAHFDRNLFLWLISMAAEIIKKTVQGAFTVLVSHRPAQLSSDGIILN